MFSHLPTLLLLTADCLWFVNASNNSTNSHNHCDSDDCENGDDGDNSDSSDSSSHPSSSDSSADSGSGHHGLSKGAIAGIVVGAILFVLLLALLAFCCWRRRTRTEKSVYSKPLPSPPTTHTAAVNTTPIRQISTAPVIPIPAFLQPSSPTAANTRGISTRHAHSLPFSTSSQDVPSAETAPLLNVPPSHSSLSGSLSTVTTLPNPYEALYPDQGVEPSHTSRHSTTIRSLASLPDSVQAMSVGHHSPTTLGAVPLEDLELGGFNDAGSSEPVLLGEMTRYQKRLEEHHRKESESAAAGTGSQLDPPPEYSAVNQ